MLKYLNPGDIPPVEVKVPNDLWENSVRLYGVRNAHEWFGAACEAEMYETVKELCNRSGIEGPYWEK